MSRYEILIYGQNGVCYEYHTRSKPKFKNGLVILNRLLRLYNVNIEAGEKSLELTYEHGTSFMYPISDIVSIRVKKIGLFKHILNK